MSSNANNVLSDIELKRSNLEINKFRLVFKFVEMESNMSKNVMTEIQLMETDAVVVVLSKNRGHVQEDLLSRNLNASNIFLKKLY